MTSITSDAVLLCGWEGSRGYSGGSNGNLLTHDKRHRLADCLATGIWCEVNRSRLTMKARCSLCLYPHCDGQMVLAHPEGRRGKTSTYTNNRTLMGNWL